MRHCALRRSAALALAIGLVACQRADARSVLPDPSPHRAHAALAAAALDTAVFAGGCFWGIEAVFRHVKGVTSAVSGYAGGRTTNPSYEEVSSGVTGHAEVVRVIYDPAKVEYGTLLKVFFSIAHDPTELNRQGPDVGTQYRSALFVRNDDQATEARAYIALLARSKVFRGSIVTEVAPLRAFYPAEAYHQNYLALHPTQPYIVYYDLPKLAALRKEFAPLVREDGIAAER